ncbi:MAG: DUF2304 family protein, partial [bacterium]|nr:DUF2304 family protein [bacterium]
MNTKIGALVICLLAVIAIIMTFRIFKKDKLSTRLLFFWLVIWFSIGFFALFPHLLDYIKEF